MNYSRDNIVSCIPKRLHLILSYKDFTAWLVPVMLLKHISITVAPQRSFSFDLSSFKLLPFLHVFIGTNQDVVKGKIIFCLAPSLYSRELSRAVVSSKRLALPVCLVSHDQISISLGIREVLLGGNMLFKDWRILLSRSHLLPFLWTCGWTVYPPSRSLQMCDLACFNSIVIHIYIYHRNSYIYIIQTRLGKNNLRIYLFLFDSAVYRLP